MWLGEQITERGIGNGISLIIFAGIVAGLPAAIGGTLELVNTGDVTSCCLSLLCCCWYWLSLRWLFLLNVVSAELRLIMLTVSKAAR